MLKIIVLLFGLTTFVVAVPTSANSAEVPEGVWFVEPDSALQIFDCSGWLCGRVVWLRNIHDSTGQIQRDKKNPDSALRLRQVCGLTVLRGLQAKGPGTWEGGSFYNPDDGETYSVNAELRSSDMIATRIYKVLPVFGKTVTLLRISRLNSEGWC